jgi:hypothetical protein
MTFVFITKVISSDKKSEEHLKHRLQGHVTVKRKDGSVWWANPVRQTEAMMAFDKICGEGYTADLLTRLFSF